MANESLTTKMAEDGIEMEEQPARAIREWLHHHYLLHRNLDQEI